MTTKVRITHLDNAHPVKVVVRDGSGGIVSQHAIAERGDEYEGYVYQGQSLEIQEGAVEAVSISGDHVHTGGGVHTDTAGSPPKGPK